MKQFKIGLLPMYIELYDKMWPHIRVHMEGFLDSIADELEKRDIRVCKGRICRLESEFTSTIKEFEELQVNAIVTLHLAYSPSLESARVLATTSLPVIVLDTTPTFDFGGGQKVEEIDYNHGIHGVQDMCNLMLRNGKNFAIEAGHWKESDVLDRVARHVKAAGIVSSIRSARVGTVGRPFDGMGDFSVPEEVLEVSMGIKTIPFKFDEAARYINSISEEDIQKELAEDIDRFSFEVNDCKAISEMHRNTAITCLVIRSWLEENKLTAFTANFLAVDKASGLPCMPFLEAGKAMARGTGYAGEGDVITAALVGALASVFPEVSFTEMFCPDWKSNSIFLSHMGEMNIALAAEKPKLSEVDFPFTDAANPMAAYGRFKAGKAVFVNLAPGRDNTFSLIVAPVEMLDVQKDDDFKNCVRGWLRPDRLLSDFLAEYSKVGGTHHAALVYGNVEDIIVEFGRMMGWKVIEL